MFPSHITRAALPGLTLSLAVVLAAIAFLCTPGATASTVHVPASPARTVTLDGSCMEDAPCWNWATMGNHRRGVVTMNGTPLVVTPRRFARLFANGNLDRYPFNRYAPRSGPRSGCMRGDATALGGDEYPHAGYYSCRAVADYVLRH